MPYPGIKPGSEAEQKMESCVKEVMATGKNKSSAIAICHNSIMGGKKVDSGSLPNQITFNINLKDYWNTVNTGATFDGSETITTGTYDTFIGEEMMDSTHSINSVQASSPQEDINDKTKGGDKKSMAKKDEKTVKKQDEEEVAEETANESEESTEAGTESVEDNAEETAAEVTKDGEEEASEDAEAEAAPAEAESDSADVEQAEEVSTLLKSVIAKIDKLVEKQDEGDGDDSATAEGAADVESNSTAEAAPEGGEEESPKEEASEGDADTSASNDACVSNDDGSSEGAEDGEVAKSLG